MNEEQSHALVYAPAEERSLKSLGKQGQNIRLASWLTGYNIDVYRDKEEGDDVELVEFADEIEEWIINEFKKLVLILQKCTG